MIWQAMSWQLEDSWQLAKGNSWQKEEIVGNWQCKDNCGEYLLPSVLTDGQIQHLTDRL
jgi:hypothetical protein